MVDDEGGWSGVSFEPAKRKVHCVGSPKDRKEKFCKATIDRLQCYYFELDQEYLVLFLLLSGGKPNIRRGSGPAGRQVCLAPVIQSIETIHTQLPRQRDRPLAQRVQRDIVLNINNWPQLLS